MKKHILLWVLMALYCLMVKAQNHYTSALLPVGTPNTIVVKYDGYTSYFNLGTNIPDSVVWTITKAQLTSTIKVPRATNPFHSSDGRQNLKRDYEHSGQDQGHNSPYGDNCYNANVFYQCFDYINMFPQRHLLNAQTWEHLEDFCRKVICMEFGACRVKTSWSGIDTKIGIDSVVVPLYCIKQIWYSDSTKVYKIPNRDTVIKHPFSYYCITAKKVK